MEKRGDEDIYGVRGKLWVGGAGAGEEREMKGEVGAMLTYNWHW